MASMAPTPTQNPQHRSACAMQNLRRVYHPQAPGSHISSKERGFQALQGLCSLQIENGAGDASQLDVSKRHRSLRQTYHNNYHPINPQQTAPQCENGAERSEDYRNVVALVRSTCCSNTLIEQCMHEHVRWPHLLPLL